MNARADRLFRLSGGAVARFTNRFNVAAKTTDGITRRNQQGCCDEQDDGNFTHDILPDDDCVLLCNHHPEQLLTLETDARGDAKIATG